MTFSLARFQVVWARQFFSACLCVNLALLLFIPLRTHAELLLVDPFDYPDGPVVDVSNGFWTTHSGLPGQMDVVSGRVELNAPFSEDVNATLLGQPYPPSSGAELFASFLVNFSTLPTAGGGYFAHFKDSTSVNFRAKIFALSAGAENGEFWIGIANAANGPAEIFPGALVLNTDYRIYIRYSVSNVVSALWVNPESENSLSVLAADPAAGRTVAAFALRQTTGIGVLQLDDLRIGTSFADVYVPPPLVAPRIAESPLNAATVEGGSAGFSVNASGTAPLHYQWQFNGEPIATATNAALVLSNVSAADAGNYSVVITNVAGATNSGPAVLTVIGPSASGTLTLVSYNVKGNFAPDWSVESPQLQAIGRQMDYLSPDIITFNEIPNSRTYEMTNFLNAFLPGYFLATNSATDGAIRSVIVSRYPIVRSQSWLAGASLTNFGYNGTYTRDLFEAEITVPNASEPLHVFTTHLKSGPDADSQDRRAAECSAVSNFFVTVFNPNNGERPYVLAGDLNEDIGIPMNRSNQPIQRLTADSTGLQLTTPLNPFTLQHFTHSIQGSLDARFDYILPAGVLAANIAGSQIFRTDQLPDLPEDLLATDSVTASDHLPVVMVFNYPDPPLTLSLTASNSTLVLNWPSLVGRKYNIETTATLNDWTVTASNIVALSSQQTWTFPVESAPQYFRVIRVP